MKKVACIVLVLMLISVPLSYAYANNSVMPCYTYIDMIQAGLSINSGTAKASGSVFPAGNLKTSITVRLQRESSDGTWITISTWIGSNNNGASEAGGTKELKTGYNYRVYVVGKVYNSNGVAVETIKKYSAIKSY